MTGGSGLKDLMACNTYISSIIDDNLSYAGYNISELVDNDASFEEVIYLLWNLHLPNRAELGNFVKIMPSAMRLNNAL